jgi:5-methyltetrahydrofolate--homocysteine methyltransferase
LIVNELHRRGLKFPVLIGGAAINRRFGRRILFTEDGEAHEPGVFYCKDAFEGSVWTSCRRARAGAGAHRAEAYANRPRPRGRPAPSGDPAARYRRPHPDAAVLGRAHAAHFRSAFAPRPRRAVPAQLGREERARRGMGAPARGLHAAPRAHAARGPARRLSRAARGLRVLPVQRRGRQRGGLRPGAVRASPSPACGGGSNGGLREIARFAFPRQPDGDRRSIADYFAPRASGPVDVLALQVVTVGPGADERFAALQARGDYAEAYFLHGLAVQTAEGTAEYLHGHIRRELGVGQQRSRGVTPPA